MIVFVGYVFSPRYYRARAQAAQRGRAGADPGQYCAVNFALHALTPSARARLGCPMLWCLSEHSGGAERGAQPDVTRSADTFRLGQSVITRDSEGLSIRLDELTCPFFQRMPERVVGTLKIEVPTQPLHVETLDTAGVHQWAGVAPHTRASLTLDSPSLRFEGSAYHDMNWGDAPLEDAFNSWTWSRAALPDGSLVTYDVVERDAPVRRRALWFDARGGVEPMSDLESAQLRRGLWGVKRSTRVDVGTKPKLVASLMDSPFYTRDLIRAQLRGAEAIAMHESLDMRRFQRGWVRYLIPFRMRIM